MNCITAKHTVTIDLKKSPDEVFDHLIQLKKWWPEDFEGEGLQLDSTFVLRTGNSHYSKNKVIEFISGKKLVWLTTESIRTTDNFDWTGTKMIFEISPQDDHTLLQFTYDGVVLEYELDRLAQICEFTVKELFYNFIHKNFTVTIVVSQSPKEVFDRITSDVAKWWGGPDLTGNTQKLYDEFIINHPGAHYSKQRLVEVIPNKKIAWLVTESTLQWLKKDQQEWTNTKMIFEMSAEGDQTVLRFTHEGLLPEMESYTMCSAGWDTVIQDYLFYLITENKSHF